MTRALHAEWTKLRTVSSTPWLLAAAVGVTVLVGAGAIGSVVVSRCPSPAECFDDTTKLALTGVWLGQAPAAVLAILAMTNEYGTRMIGSTLAANPRRLQVLAAKATVLGGIVLVAAVLAVLGSVVVGRWMLSANGLTAANGLSPPSLFDGPTLRAAVGTVLYFGLVALLSLGVAALVRDTAGAITAVFALLYAAPMISLFVSDPAWARRLERIAPMTAGLAVQATRGLDRLPIGPWAGLGVLAAYAGAALVLGAIVFKARDA